MWNETKIEIPLRNNDSAGAIVAIVAIYDRQTQTEKASSGAKHNNARSFRANHTPKGSYYYARWVLGGRRLTGHHLDNARKDRVALPHRKPLP